jgi:hypothetical protein
MGGPERSRRENRVRGTGIAAIVVVALAAGCVRSDSSVQAADGDSPGGSAPSTAVVAPGDTSEVAGSSDDLASGSVSTSSTTTEIGGAPAQPPSKLDPPGSASTERDADRAHRVLLTPEVMPGARWSTTVAPARAFADLLSQPACVRAHPDFRVPPSAPTGRDSMVMEAAIPGLEFGQVVDLFADDAAARHLGELVASPNIERCVAPAIRNSNETDGFTVGSLTLTPWDGGVTAESMGADMVAGFSLTYSLTSPWGVKGETTQWMLIIVVGRAMIELDWVSVARTEGNDRPGASVKKLEAFDWPPVIRNAGRGLSIEMAKG